MFGMPISKKNHERVCVLIATLAILQMLGCADHTTKGRGNDKDIGPGVTNTMNVPAYSGPAQTSRYSNEWVIQSADILRNFRLYNARMAECSSIFAKSPAWEKVHPYECAWAYGDTHSIVLDTRRELWELWKLTGHCLFSDIREEELANSLTVIINRYNSFINKNDKFTAEFIQKRGLEHTATLVKTHYWMPAMYHFSCTLWFGGVWVSTEPLVTYSPLPKKDSDWMVNQIRSWLAENEDIFRWDKEARFFTKPDGSPFDAKIMDEVFARGEHVLK